MLSKEIFKGNRINFTFSVIFILLFSLISVFVAVLLQMYMDVAAYGELGDIPRLLLYTLIYILGYGITIYFYHFFQNRFIEKGMYNYKNQILYRLLSHKAFDFRQTSTGVYLSALTNDIETVRNDYLANLISLTYNVAVFIFALATMAYYNIILCPCFGLIHDLSDFSRNPMKNSTAIINKINLAAEVDRFFAHIKAEIKAPVRS